MSAGFQVFNENGEEILNTNDPMLVVVATGNSTGQMLSIPWPYWPEPPTLFIQPQAESWCGGLLIFRNPQSGNAEIYCAGVFKYALCVSSYRAPIVQSARFGIETYSENGRLIFSSNYSFARIRTIVGVAGPYTDSRGVLRPQSAAFSGFTIMPWVIMNNACLSFPTEMSSVEYLMKINAGMTTLTVTMGDTLFNSYNQYYGKTMYFPLATIAGI